MSGNVLENQKKIKPDELIVVREIQDIYMTNLRCLGYNPKRAIVKKTIKDSRKTVYLFNQINQDFLSCESFLFDDEMLTKRIDKFEDAAIKSDYRHFDYEWVMCSIHENLRSIGYGICVDHNINIHYCERCHERLGLDKEL